MSAGRRIAGALMAVTFLGAAPAPAQTRLLVVSGVSGEPRFATAFHLYAQGMIEAARSRFGVTDSAITWLAEDPAKSPGRIAGRSTKDAIAGAIAATAGRMRPGERLLLLVIAHGSVGDPPRLALPGPDLTPAELSRMLSPLGERDVGIVLAASASGGFVPALTGPRRVVIAAAKEMEGNETRFPQHFVAAFTKDGADRDKDGRISLLEAFAYAGAEVRREYDDDGKLLTEHAILEDDGDGKGSAPPGDAGSDGRLARAFVLDGGRAAASANPAVAALETQKREIERRVESLRGRKTQMETKAYEDALETLMVELAGVNRKIRETGGRP